MLRKKNRGEILTATDYNNLIDAINQNQIIRSKNQLVSKSAHGTSIIQKSEKKIKQSTPTISQDETFVGKIKSLNSDNTILVAKIIDGEESSQTYKVYATDVDDVLVGNFILVHQSLAQLFEIDDGGND